MAYEKWADVFNERAHQYENPLDVCHFYCGDGYYGDAWFEAACGLIAGTLQLQPDDHVLEVGCGCAVYLKRLLPRAGKFVGVDLAEEVIKRARYLLPEVEFHLAAADALPFEDHSFDKVYAHGLMHYMADFEEAERAVLEMARVVVPGGRLFVGHVPNAERDEEYQSLRRARNFKRDRDRRDPNHNLRWLWYPPEFFDRFRDRFASVEVNTSKRSFDPTYEFRFDVLIEV